MSSDYGSDINIDGEDHLLGLLDKSDSYSENRSQTPLNFSQQVLEEVPALSIDGDEVPEALEHPRLSGPRGIVLVPVFTDQPAEEDNDAATAVQYPDLSSRLASKISSCSYRSRRTKDTLTKRLAGARAHELGTNGEEPDRIAEAQPVTEPTDTPIPPKKDTRSPFDRFRSRKGYLSVTDLVSGVWCEKQFEYTLERGFRRRTPAMKRGTKIHKILEEQIHTTVPVEVTTKEDEWGLKLFNMCQGLQSLRTEGLTRELDVFGFLDGIFVLGVIDELSYLDPNTPAVDLSSDSSGGGVPIDLTDSSPLPVQTLPRIAYLSDTKTRATQSIPSGSQRRATALQLMFYHRLLSELLAGKVDFSRVLESFQLNGANALSDGFISQVGSLESAISLEELLENNSLWGLWSIMQSQLGETIGAIGDTLEVNYRSQKYGDIMDTKTFGYDNELLVAHLDHTIQWWQGERETTGVEIEDAWKCRITTSPPPSPSFSSIADPPLKARDVNSKVTAPGDLPN